jgi:hypothetical protein
VAHQFLTGFTAPNTWAQAQPAFSDVSGTVSATQLGSVTDGVTLDQSGAGSTLEIKSGGVGTTQIAASAVTNAKLANASMTVSGASCTLGGSCTVGYSGISGTPTEVVGETPSGTVNNSNKSFTLVNTPISGTLQLYLDGLRTTAFTISTNTITMTTAPNYGQTLTADYDH